MKDIVVFSNGPDESTVSELWGEIFESAQALVRESSTALTNVTDACEETSPSKSVLWQLPNPWTFPKVRKR
jgi:hypothetical protein